MKAPIVVGGALLMLLVTCGNSVEDATERIIDFCDTDSTKYIPGESNRQEAVA
ncbi:MAG: hypothetical protein OEM84_05190 [Acidimicrobiia bacterium]|nr:hypothetical protein [Acidimicrobiia bacterium]